MTAEELDANERQAFLIWRRNLARFGLRQKIAFFLNNSCEACVWMSAYLLALGCNFLIDPPSLFILIRFGYNILSEI